jgi:putative heme-binding domain-containing protein
VQKEQVYLGRSAARLLAALILSSASIVPSRATGAGQAPPVKFYREWTVAELLPSVGDLGAGHEWAAGRELFKKAGCGLCHAFGAESEGTGLAPDLTGVGSTFTRDFILQSIIEPSATINGRFFQTTFTLKNGRSVTGSVIEAGGGKILVAPVMMNPQATVEIASADVKSEEPSRVSAMPAGLLNEFTKAQIIELLAFLDAGGDRGAPVYRKK